LLAFAASCQSNEPARQHAKLGPVGYDMPADWVKTDRGTRTTVWTPPDNEQKESVTVTRADLDPALAKAGPAALAPLLVKAQGTLAAAQVSTPEPVTTALGLHGYRVTVQFTPRGTGSRTYTRVHELFVDGTTLVHVMYTAANADLDSAALKMAVDSAHKEG
jgi:hypothetical protein